jgi:hypothetical protein
LTLDTNTHAARTRTGTCTHVRNRSPSSPPRARGESEILGTTVAPPGAQNFFTWSIYCNMHAARTRTGTHGRARTSGPGLSDLANKSVDIIVELHAGVHMAGRRVGYYTQDTGQHVYRYFMIDDPPLEQ